MTFRPNYYTSYGRLFHDYNIGVNIAPVSLVAKKPLAKINSVLHPEHIPTVSPWSFPMPLKQAMAKLRSK